MALHIEIEDLVANAFINVLPKDNNKRFISYKEIEYYGDKVVEYLKNEKEEKASFNLSRATTNEMYHKYADYFEEQIKDGYYGVHLKDEIERQELIEKFCGYLNLDVLLALYDKNNLSTINK